MAPSPPFAMSSWVSSLFDSGSAQVTYFGHWNVSRNDVSTVLEKCFYLSAIALCYHHKKDTPRVSLLEDEICGTEPSNLTKYWGNPRSANRQLTPQYVSEPILRSSEPCKFESYVNVFVVYHWCCVICYMALL